MITTFATAIKTWIFTKNGDELPVARVLDFVVDPNDGRIPALWAATPEGLKLLAINDILRWRIGEVLITDENELLKPNNFPKVTAILKREAPIIGAKVFAEKTENCLGKVRNFSFDTISPRILSIHIQKGFWPFVRRRIIHRTQIVKISNDGIFIKNEAKAKTKIEFGNKKIANVED